MRDIFKRRNYFIDKKFQTKFIVKFCLIVVVSSALIVGGILYLSQNSNTVAIENTKVVVKRTSDFILPIVIITLAAVSLLSGITVFILTLLISHKISGPLFRLQREITSLASGDFRRNFRIRGDDQLQELSRSLDDMCKSLRNSNLEIRDNYASLKRFLENKDYCIGKKDAEEFLFLVDKLQSDLDNFKF
ncbi:MAG: methyl-accepting chemotaxis protein [Candidatus Omnitrophica bacterium]|nr:methyl-accepting chemotaxis protein [Candidatus Omnitrophota bacterium]